MVLPCCKQKSALNVFLSSFYAMKRVQLVKEILEEVSKFESKWGHETQLEIYYKHLHNRR